ncbi:MAG TPA: SdrD B-like domain-containing protein [Candidatus Angelobacter sp.]|nr:SdrD B-like domain-containing protein [Candidatus Angelobacter sp.]
MRFQRNIAVMVALLGLLSIYAPVPAAAQSADTNGVPSLVEVYWQWSRTVAAPALTNLIVLDQEIARVEVATDGLKIFGLERGETVLLGYLHDQPVSIRVRVVGRPQMVVSPAALRRQSEMAQGSFGSSVQIANSGGQTTSAIVNDFYWTQPAGNQGRLFINTQMEDNNLEGGHAFNVRHGNIAYRSPGMDVSLLDNVFSLTDNGPQHHFSPFTYSDSIELRGAGLTLRHGDNQYMFFGGTTVPFYFLTLGSTRDIGGFSFNRKQSSKLNLFATTSFIDSPADFFNPTGGRSDDWMQTGGFGYQPDGKWTLQGTGGVSTHGGMGRGEVNYISHRLTFFAAGGSSSMLFPLNRVQSLFSGTTSAKAGVTVSLSDRLSESLYYQHTITQAFGNILHAGSSDYLTPAFSWRVNPRDDVNFSYTYSRNDGGFSTQATTGNRFDTNWRHQVTPRISNAAQFVAGSLQDPLQLSSEDEFTLRDSLTFLIKGGSMMVGVEHDRRNPSLVRKLGSELELLSPTLQALFLQDPISFVESNNLPPEVRALLEAQVPISTSISASAQLRPTKKLSVNPNFSFARTSNGKTDSWTPFAGYSLAYQVRPSFDFNSGMTNVWVLGNNANTVQRSTLVYFGFTKRFNAMPGAILPARHVSRIIEGRVFRDNNVNGAFNFGEQGLVGLQVRLDDGETAETDEQGRYKFADVSQGEHTVSLALTQFSGPVRMTTKNQASVDLIRQRISVVNFGIVDFARVTGSVFNDLRFEGKRPQDAKGLAGVHLTLDDGKIRRSIVAQDTGDFEVDDVTPGDYRISVDASTLPANYSLAEDTFTLHVSPVSTTVQNIPARALRSIAGRVFVKVLAEPAAQPPDSGKLKISGVPAGSVRSQRGGGQQAGGRVSQTGRGQAQGTSGPTTTGDYNLVPLAGVQITAGFGVARTDENGNFLLRDLPAGDLTVTLIATKDLPEGMKVPSGQVKMPADPIQVQGASIVISNPDLAPYLVDAPKADAPKSK